MRKARFAATAFCACALVISLSVPSFGAGLPEGDQNEQASPATGQASEDHGSSSGVAEGAPSGGASTPKKPDVTQTTKPAAQQKKSEKLTAAEKKHISKASECSSKAGSLVSELSGPAGELADEAARLAKQRKRLSKLQKQSSDMKEDIETAQAALDDAQHELDQIRAEESSLTGVSYYSVLFGKVRYKDLVSWSSDISQREAAARSELSTRQERLDGLKEQAAALDKKVAQQEQKVDKTVAAGNETALALEKADSKSRMADEDAAQHVEKLDAKQPKARQAREDIEAAARRHDATRSASRDELTSWYDAVNAISNVETDLVFGTGADFALAEEDFVEKWGPAIDAFFGQLDAPLAGQGKTMAKYAYEYKIDPRLCAAVSIIESSGGVHCIKAHNAWGWGAADSDPYGGASSWSSWDEAIREWHKGMAESNTGLAQAGSLSELGETYCSSAHWVCGVAEQFEKIDACVG